jgi:hypothetical protein
MSKTSPTLDRLRIKPRPKAFLDRNQGAVGEIFYDGDSASLRLYDGKNTGGIDVARADLSNVSSEGLIEKTVDAGIATAIFNVTVEGPQAGDSGNKYVLNNVYRAQPTLIIGYTYVFIQDDLTNVYFPNANNTTPNPHPLNFSADNLSGELGGGTSYLDGVKYFLNGELVDQATYTSSAFITATSRQVWITVTSNTPAELFYWCYNHVAMGNSISVAKPGSGSGGASVDISSDVPENPVEGDLWWDSTEGNLYIYYNDGDSEQWAPASNSNIGTGIVTSVDLSAGTGISVSGGPITSSGVITVTNTAPDQVVFLTAGTGITTSGSYPNFTVTNSQPDQVVVLTAGTGITTSGSYPNFTVTNSQPDQVVVLTGAGATSVSGTYPNFIISSTDTDTDTTYTAGTGINLTGTTFSVDATVVRSDTTVTTGAGAITNIISITQADYDNIVTPDATTLYIITE